jgi:hypothetical protein
MTHRYKNNPQDEQVGQSGKNANDTNKQGEQKPTQKNEGRRTPESRHDREDHIGGKANQKLVRTGMAGQGDKGGPNSRTGRKP